MKLFKRCCLLLVGQLLVTACTSIASGPSTPNVSIPFASLGNIRDWQAEGNNVLYVQSMHRDWYRITLFAPCFELPFANGISFVTDTIGSLDKFSSILVRGERCWFQTFEKSDAPVPVNKSKKAEGKDDKNDKGQVKDDKPKA